MPIVTILNSTGTRWGTSGYTNSSDPFTLGRTADYTCKGRVGFDALPASWYIKSIKLYMKRVDGYSSKVLKIGTNSDSSYENRTALDWSQNISVSSGTDTKSWDLTAYKSILQGYTTTWYFHFDHGSGDSSYCQFTAGSGSSAPRLVVEYEEASITVPGNSFTIGVASGIVVGTSGSGLTHTLKYSIGTLSNVVIQSNITAGATVSWTPPTTIANQITTAMSGTITMTLESYSGGVLTSTLTFQYTVHIPSSYKPSINTGSTTFAIVGTTLGVYVQGRSKTLCTISAASVYGAAIAQYKLTIGGVTYTKKSTDTEPNKITSNVLTTSGALSATIEVTDTRGQVASVVIASAITVYAYAAPSVSSFTVTRCLSDGTVSNSGTYIKYTVTYNFSSLNNLNTPRSGSVKFKPSGGSYGTSTAISTSSFAATVSGVIGAGTIGAGSYVVAVTLTDVYNTVVVETELTSQLILMDFHNSGSGVAIGKTAVTSGLFDVGTKANFDDRVYMKRGFYVHYTEGTAGTAGWAQICQINITAIYANAPIEIHVAQRRLPMIARLYIQFANLDGTDPALAAFTYEGNLKSAYIQRVGAGMWAVWVEKTEAWDAIGVTDIRTSEYMWNKISVQYSNAHSSSIPAGGVKAAYAYGDAVIPIGNGGTGAINALGALTNLGIQFGSIATTLPSNGTRTGSVTFAVPYAAGTLPNIQLTLGDIIGSYDRVMKLAATALSNTGFTWSLTYEASSSNACTVHWLTIGTY